VSFSFRHLLGIEALTRDEISFLLEQSRAFQGIQRQPLKKLATLRGKSAASPEKTCASPQSQGRSRWP
jgi:aspartate carbamoyltransferase catalytic subunit